MTLVIVLPCFCVVGSRSKSDLNIFRGGVVDYMRAE
jgi:hypothetical protein